MKVKEYLETEEQLQLVNALLCQSYCISDNMCTASAAGISCTLLILAITSLPIYYLYLQR